MVIYSSGITERLYPTFEESDNEKSAWTRRRLDGLGTTKGDEGRKWLVGNASEAGWDVTSADETTIPASWHRGECKARDVPNARYSWPRVDSGEDGGANRSSDGRGHAIGVASSSFVEDWAVQDRPLAAPEPPLSRVHRSWHGGARPSLVGRGRIRDRHVL